MNVFFRSQKTRLFFFTLVTVCLLAGSALAQNKVVVIPLSGGKTKPLKNIVTVAKANGDFTDLAAAVNSITDASMENPYLVVIGPGIYSITSTLQMKPFVSIMGSGRDVTILSGAISSDSIDSNPPSLISLAYRTTLSDLTVSNGGDGQYNIAISTTSSSNFVTVERLNIHAGKG
ncbi:MAG: hypothetical protein DSY50_02870, partial [Desulfobulbus sp.]